MRPLFPEMQEAVSDGHIHTFEKTENGDYRCLSFPARSYKPNEYEEQILNSNTERVTLHRITTIDGIKGTYYKYHTHN